MLINVQTKHDHTQCFPIPTIQPTHLKKETTVFNPKTLQFYTFGVFTPAHWFTLNRILLTNGVGMLQLVIASGQFPGESQNSLKSHLINRVEFFGLSLGKMDWISITTNAEFDHCFIAMCGNSVVDFLFICSIFVVRWIYNGFKCMNFSSQYLAEF